MQTRRPWKRFSVYLVEFLLIAGIYKQNRAYYPF
jgi:hypothetical protein